MLTGAVYVCMCVYVCYFVIAAVSSSPRRIKGKKFTFVCWKTTKLMKRNYVWTFHLMDMDYKYKFKFATLHTSTRTEKYAQVHIKRQTNALHTPVIVRVSH